MVQGNDNHLISLKNNEMTHLSRGNTWPFSLLSALVIDEYTRWVLWIPVFIGIGISLYFSLQIEPPILTGGIGAIVFAGLTCRWRRKSCFFQVSLALFSVFLGLFAAQLRTIDVDAVVLTREIGPTRVVGRIIQMEPKAGGARLLLDHVSIVRLEPFATPDKIRVTARFGEANSVKPGDWISIRAVLRPPAAPVSPGAFDFQRYAFFKEIGATGYSYGPPEIRQGWQETTTIENLGTWLARFRLAMGERIRKALDGETGALAAALITGERLAIPEQAVIAMRYAGLAHLLAISGLHIGLVAGLVFFLVRAGLALIPGIALKHPIKSWAAVTALAAAFCYTLLAGATIPTLRSFAMMALVLGAVMMGRRAISMRSVALAATIVLLMRPESLLGPSFQLSFAAVIALVAVYEWVSKYLPAFWGKGTWLRRVAAYIGGVALTTLVAGLATSPFAAFHFHHLASYGIIANLISVPLTALCIMPAALVAVLLMPFGLEAVPLAIMGLGIEGLLSTARAVADLPGNLRLFPAIPLSALIIMALGGLWLCLWQRWWRVMGLAAGVIGLGIAGMAETPVILASENAEVFALQTKQGITFVGPGVRGNRYTRSAWLERAGYSKPPGPTGEADTLNPDAPILCDHMGCVMTIGNSNKVSVVWDEGALLEDCWAMDIIISAVPVRKQCNTPRLVIDRFDLWRNGAYALYADGDDIRVEHTRDVRGDRPWTRAAKRTRPVARNPES